MSLHTKYRPKTFKEVVGQGPIVASLSKNIERKSSHCYLLVGPSGVGKTTIARIAAKQLGCKRPNEFNAAKYTGKDDVDALTDSLMYPPLDGGIRVIIVDECHQLSKSAWNSLLKDTEEPPEWLYWFLCTTEVSKVLPTIKTRCTTYNLKPVDIEACIYPLLTDICSKEKLKVDKKIITLCADESQGSPRQAITNLEACLEAKNLEEAKDLLQSAGENSQAIDLARALIKGAKWKEVSGILRGMKDEDPEGVRQVVRGYMTAVALNNPNQRVLAILDEFCTPFNSRDKISPVLMSCARLLLH